ncbi:hypothetical protein [Mesorhizobium huakuii]|uniref:hypothetical protein n=1 Tax=Mesorhizobium huakuii TaxID=28104 RepID=UPI0032AFA1A1
MPIAGRPELTPYPEDAALIKEYRKEAATNIGSTNATDLRSFSDYLRQNNKKGIAGRLSGEALDGDVKAFKEDTGGHRNIGFALAQLRKSQAGAKAMELERRVPTGPDLDDAALMEPRRVGDAAAQQSAWPEAGSWPEELQGQQDNQPAPSFFIAPGKLPAGLDNLDSIGAGAFGAAGSGQAGVQAATRPLLAVSEQQIRRSPGAIDRGNLLPTEWVIINNEHSTALLRPAKRQRTLNAPSTVAIQQQLSETGNSGGRMPMQPSTYPVGALPLEGQPVMRERESEYIPRLHAETSGIGGATAQHSAPHEAIALPPMEDYDQDLLWGGLDKAGPQPFLGSSASHHQPPDSAEAVHPSNWRNDHQSAADELAGSNVLPSRQDGGFEAMVHQNPPTSFELNAWVPSPDFPPLFAGPVPGRYQGARQPGSPQELSLVPASSDDEALAWLSEELVRRRMQDPASPSTARAQDLYPGFEALVDPDPAELGYNAHFAPAPSARAPSDIYGDLDSLVDLPSTPVDLRDDAHSAPVRPRGQMVETEWQQMMQGTGSAAVLRQGGPDDVQLIHHTRPRPMSEAAPAAPARAPGPGWPVTAKLPDTYRGLPVVDVTTSTTILRCPDRGVGSDSLVQCHQRVGARRHRVAERRPCAEGLRFRRAAAAGDQSDARRPDTASQSVGIPSTAPHGAAKRARHIAVHL